MRVTNLFDLELRLSGRDDSVRVRLSQDREFNFQESGGEAGTDRPFMPFSNLLPGSTERSLETVSASARGLIGANIEASTDDDFVTGTVESVSVVAINEAVHPIS